MNKTTRGILDVIFFIIVFVLINLLVTYAVGAGSLLSNGDSWSEISDKLTQGTVPHTPTMLVLEAVVSSLLTMLVFIACRWVGVSRVWLASHPWGTLTWVFMLSLGTILPSEWLIEQMELTLPLGTEKLFEGIMKEPTGYLAIGILAPLAEEIVFRGGVLRVLLGMFNRRWHWVAIVISALLFGALHFNWAQFVHAALIGLLLGWMFYRTDSIIPGVVFHWVNNTVAYVMFNMMPQMADGKLIDLFHGDHKMMVLGLVFSLCIFLPSLFQLNIRLKKG